MPRGSHRVEADTFAEPWRLPLKKWEVQTLPIGPGQQAVTHTIEAHYCFNNGAEGLIFRTYDRNSTKTSVTAAFAAGSWSFYKEVS